MSWRPQTIATKHPAGGATKGAQVFEPSARNLVVSGVLWAIIVAPWFTPWFLPVSLVAFVVAVVLTHRHHRILVTESDVVGPNPVLFRKRIRIGVNSAMLKRIDWGWCSYEIGSSEGDERISVWMLTRDRRTELYRTLSLEIPKGD